MGQTYLFIDGGYLRKALESLSQEVFGNHSLNIDSRELTRNSDKAFYYDCLPKRRRGECQQEYLERHKNAENLFRTLRRTPGVHVIEGRISGTSKPRQKMIDVSITVDMLTHSHRRNMERVILLAGDLDFKPLVNALVLDGMYVNLWYEARSVSDGLLEAADSHIPFNAETVFKICPSISAQISKPQVLRTARDIHREPVLATGKKSSDGLSASVWQDINGYLLELDELDDPKTVIQIRHNDRDFIERFVQNVYGPYEWSTRW